MAAFSHSQSRNPVQPYTKLHKISKIITSLILFTDNSPNHYLQEAQLLQRHSMPITCHFNIHGDRDTNTNRSRAQGKKWPFEPNPVSLNARDLANSHEYPPETIDCQKLDS